MSSGYINLPVEGGGSGGVTSLNSQTGDLNLLAGTNITIVPGVGTLTINAIGDGTGDVHGPASSTDSGFVKFDGTTGKLIKDSPATISNSDVNAAAAIALSKLAAMTASRAVVSDGSGILSPSATTSTELGFVSGVTSAIQAQLNAKQATGNYITALTGDGTATGPGSVLFTLATVPIAKGGTGQTTANAGFAALSPLTTDYDLITQVGGIPVRMAKGANNTALQVVAGALAWVATPSPYTVSTISSATAGVSGSTYLCNTSGAAFTLTLPAPVAGAFIIIKDKTGSFQTNNLTLAPNSTEQIEGLAANKVLQTSWGSWSFFSDGTDWFMGPF